MNNSLDRNFCGQSMLRRRGAKSEQMVDITTPLLGEDSAQIRTPASQLPDRSLPLPPPPPCTKWWRKLLHQLVRLYDNLIDLLYWQIWTRIRPQPHKISLLQESRLETLWHRITVPYDVSMPEHLNYLQRLWTAVFPAEDVFPPEIRSPQWKLMGWQGENPATDFRGGGFLSLEMLVSFAETRPEQFQGLMRKERGTRSDWEYPFCAAGVNISYMLVGTVNFFKIFFQ